MRNNYTVADPRAIGWKNHQVQRQHQDNTRTVKRIIASYTPCRHCHTTANVIDGTHVYCVTCGATYNV